MYQVATATSEVVDFFLRRHHGYPCPGEGLKRRHGAGGTGLKVACFVTPPPVRVGYKCIFFIKHLLIVLLRFFFQI